LEAAKEEPKVVEEVKAEPPKEEPKVNNKKKALNNSFDMNGHP